MTSRIGVCLAVLAGLAAVVAAEEKKPKKSSLKFTVGKETTYATGPLLADGRVDYLAALNTRMRRGVTPANNANALLWKALGPHPEGAKMSPEFFKWFQIEAPPEKGDYFIPLHRYGKDKLGIAPGPGFEALYEQQMASCRRAWKKWDHPPIAGWLEANEKPLALVVAACKRTHYYSPLVASKKDTLFPLISALLPAVQKCRELATALTARAMLHLGAGRRDAAWQDLLACHRLARHLGQGGTLIEMLVSVAIDTIAGNADLVFLSEGKLTPKQIRACQRDLEKLPPMPRVADKVDLTERFMFLESVFGVARGGLPALEGLVGGGKVKPIDPKVKKALQGVDWDPALRTGNGWFDRLSAALRIKERPDRVKKLAELEQDLKSLKTNLATDEENLNLFLLGKDSPKAKGRLLGDILVSLLVPAITKVQQASDRSEQTNNNLRLAFALAAYRAEQGRYPTKLGDVAPKYLARVPPDLFTGKPLFYRTFPGGYQFYSFGVNGLDDGGHGYQDDPRGDDLGVRMPLPQRK